MSEYQKGWQEYPAHSREQYGLSPDATDEELEAEREAAFLVELKKIYHLPSDATPEQIDVARQKYLSENSQK